MQNLFAFLRRFRVFIFFLFLQLVCLFIYVQFMNYPRSVYLSSANQISGSFHSFENTLTEQLHLQETNRKLQYENIQLRKRVFSDAYKVQRGQFTIDDTAFLQRYTYTPCVVVNSTLNKRDNYFTVDVGYQQGIKKGMGVITPNGILGVVFKSGKHFSLVKSVLSQDINTDVSIGNKGIHGILKWGGKHAKFGTITGVSNDLVVKKWSKVKTLGASGIFPKGIVIGSVYKIKRVENQALWDITIKYSEDYRSLQVAYIVNALFLKETQALERSIPLETEL